MKYENATKNQIKYWKSLIGKTQTEETKKKRIETRRKNFPNWVKDVKKWKENQHNSLFNNPKLMGKNNHNYGKPTWNKDRKSTAKERSERSLACGGTGIPLGEHVRVAKNSDKLWQCECCGKTEKENIKEVNKNLNAHHIDRNRKNNKLSNLQILCHKCHFFEHFKEIMHNNPKHPKW